MDRGAWRAIAQGVTESNMTESLNNNSLAGRTDGGRVGGGTGRGVRHKNTWENVAVVQQDTAA